MAVRDSYYPVVISFLVIDGFAVGLRFWARGIKKAIGYDDVTMAFSLVGFIVFCAMELEAVRYGIGATTLEDGFDMIKAAMAHWQFFIIAQIVYILTTGISKLGVALVLFRLASGADMKAVRLILIITIFIVSIWSLVTALIYAPQCRPLSVAWGVGKGTCISTNVLGNSGIALSVMDMTMSWFYALLPVHMLYKTQLRLKLKISILVLLGLGALSSIATIIRLKFVISVAKLSATGGLANAEVISQTLEGTL
ncbi:integral membrane [Fusarium albosuccineum]|uniref:Integral membrane n=1 Tax=Fusarium albosuccineum TaxID=1237068 RepID=A0A8H4PJ71_9HYPO|nr:integral membrane [Fusarium albosuccineum]